MSRGLAGFGLVVIVAGCASTRDAPKSAPHEAPAAITTRVAFPRAGIAVRDTAGKWCAEFVNDSTAAPLRAGDRVSIVFAGAGTTASLDARIGGPHVGQCYAEFAQPRWNDYSAYGVELTSTASADVVLGVALIVAGDAKWTRDADGLPRADLDGDGVREEARRCLADEGEHFTIWSVRPGAAPVARWHEYYDWGAFTDANCKPGEKGPGG